VVFRPAHLSKQSRSSKPMADFFPSFVEDLIICPMPTLKTYEERTESFVSRFQCFLSFIGHAPVTSSTIARWLKSFMEEAGIDISNFKTHSVRGAVCSTGIYYQGYSRCCSLVLRGHLPKFFLRRA